MNGDYLFHGAASRHRTPSRSYASFRVHVRVC